jgi:hypothetical protein
MEIVPIALSVFLMIFLINLGLYFFKEHIVSREQLHSISKIHLLEKKSQQEIQFYRNLAREYKLELDCYKKGLGIFPGDRQDAAEELWTRAAQGEEDAYYIMLELMDVELEVDGKKLPQNN